MKLPISIPLFAPCLVVLLTGCAATVTLVDRRDGQEYAGKSKGGTMGSEGELSADVEGATYVGHWIYSATGGGYSLGTAAAFSGGTSAFATGSGASVSAQGSGLINMRAADGRFIRCVFNFNTWSDTGIGECIRNDGRQYDLRVKR
jgi:hypothetical protein